MEHNLNWSIAIALVLVASLVVPASVVAVSGTDDAEACSFPFSKTDATGTEVTVDAAPESVVTLSPSAAQTMWEIGAKDTVVGVTKYAAYLDGASEKTNVSGSGFTAVVVEKVVALDPDLVLAPNVVSDETVTKLRESGLTVYKFRAAETLEDVVEKTELTGTLVGECDGARATVEEMNTELQTVRDAVDGETEVRTLYVMPGNYTAGNGTFIHELIETAGGTNVAAEAGISGYKPLNDEVVADQDPEWLVLTSGQPSVPDRAVYDDTTAVQEGNTVVVDSNLVSQPAPRIVDVLVELATAFHPDSYATAAATETPTETPPATNTESPTATDTPVETPTSTETPSTTAPPGTTETTSPGFTAALSLAVVLATLVLVTRSRR